MAKLKQMELLLAAQGTASAPATVSGSSASFFSTSTNSDASNGAMKAPANENNYAKRG